MFDWMDAPRRSPDPDRVLAIVHAELRARAKLLVALGYRPDEIEARLGAAMRWEHELVGRPRALGDVGRLVREVAGREAGGGPRGGEVQPKEGGGPARPRRGPSRRGRGRRPVRH